MADLRQLLGLDTNVRQIASLLKAKAPAGEHLAYINDEEAQLLRDHGGSGRMHGDTGIPSYSYEMGGYDTGYDYGGGDGGFQGFDGGQNYDFGGGDQSVSVQTPQFGGEQQSYPGSQYFDQGYAPPAQPQFEAPQMDMPQFGGGQPQAFPGQQYMQPSYTPPGMPEQAAAPQDAGFLQRTLNAGSQGIDRLVGGIPNAVGNLPEALVRSIPQLLQARQQGKTVQRAAQETQKNVVQPIQQIGQPYTQRGQAGLARADQGGLTPGQMQQINAAQARTAQGSERIGGVGAQQAQNRLIEMQADMVQKNYQNALQEMAIGDKYLMAAIQAGVLSNKDVAAQTQKLMSNLFYNMLPGTQPVGGVNMADAALSSALNVGPVDRAVRAPTSKPTPEPKIDLGTKLEKERDSARENVAKMVGEQAQYQNDQEMFKVKQQGEDAAKKAELLRQERASITGSDPYKQLQDTELAIAKEQFHPTERSIGENLALAAATTIMGHMIGKGGKVPATITLAGMNGMMEGIRAGDLNRYKEQKQKFEDGLNNLVRKSQTLSKQLERITKLAATDKEEAYYEAQALFAKEGADFMAQHARQRGLAATLELAKASAKKAEETLSKYEIESQRRQDKLDALQYSRGTQIIVGDRRASNAQTLETLRQANRILLEGEKTKNRSHLKGGSTSDYVARFTGATLQKDDANAVSDAATSIGQASELKKRLADHPDFAGRQGQVNNYVDRYINSFRSGESPDGIDQDAANSDIDQASLRFAKEYAAYLVSYERSLAGGAKGFTVALQKRFNELMKQDQFNATGLTALLDDQIQEVARSAAKRSDQITAPKLIAMGNDIISRSKPDYAPSETPSLSPQAEPEKPVPTEADRARAKSNPTSRQNFINHFGVEP